MPKIESLEGLMVEEMRDMIDAEKQLIKALPKMAKAAESDQLRAGFEQHRSQTETQLERLMQAFDEIGEKPKAKKCTGMRGLIEEGEEMMKEVPRGPVRDALLIASAQKVEHYEMSSYGTLRTYANQLGHQNVAGLLETTLKEEKATDQKLTQLAESMVNPSAREKSRSSPGEERMIGAAVAQDRPGRASPADNRNRKRSASSGSRRGGSRLR
ncbi:MAG: ferritin-like domain-containing protein [Vicinamibacterales bacterium]